MDSKDEFLKDFISVGELRKMIEHLSDKDMITVKIDVAKKGYQKIQCIEDSTAIGFWEIRCDHIKLDNGNTI